MEWIFVRYDRVCDVFIDGRRSGQTNCLLAVAEGTHRLDLGVPVDYSPDKRIETITGTSDGAPLEVDFNRAA